MILKLLLNTQIIWIFIKTLAIIIQKKPRKIMTVSDIIPDILSNKKLNRIVSELFII